MNRSILIIVLLLGPVCIGGCASRPLSIAEVHDVDQAAILIRWQDAVDEAYHRPGVHWHHGWVGNAAVASDNRKNFGKCTDWQELAYLAVRKTAAEVGYQVRMIRVNHGTLEHDAVAVFKLGPGRSDDLLFDREFQRQVIVLDGWKRGRADAWPLDRWLASQEPMLERLEVFDGEHELALRKRRGVDLAGRGFSLRANDNF